MSTCRQSSNIAFDGFKLVEEMRMFSSWKKYQISIPKISMDIHTHTHTHCIFCFYDLSMITRLWNNQRLKIRPYSEQKEFQENGKPNKKCKKSVIF